MSIEDFKVYTANFLSITLSFSNLHDGVKFLLLIATLGYTLHKWYLMYERNKTNKDK